jgi:hypothetical protein
LQTLYQTTRRFDTTRGAFVLFRHHPDCSFLNTPIYLRCLLLPLTYVNESSKGQKCENFVNLKFPIFLGPNFWMNLGTAIHSTISSTGLTFLRWDGTIPNCTTKPIRPFQGVRRALKPCCDLPRFQHASDLGLPKILQQLSSHHHWYRIFLFARGRSKR